MIFRIKEIFFFIIVEFVKFDIVDNVFVYNIVENFKVLLVKLFEGEIYGLVNSVGIMVMKEYWVFKDGVEG